MEPPEHNSNTEVEILIVEDSPTQAERLKYILEQHHYRFSAARNGREALAVIAQNPPTLVISDIVMPEMDGYQLCGHIKKDEKLKGIPVILLTSLTDPLDVMKGLECGADNFIFKPYDEQYLLARISYMLANRRLGDKDGTQMGVGIFFGGRRFFITSDRLQILNLLLSTYEAAVHKNHQLAAARDELRGFNKTLDETNRRLEREITERKRAEEALHRAHEELTRANTELAHASKHKDEFLANMSHELRTPLNSILGLSEALLEQISGPLTERQIKSVTTISNSGQHLLALINDILDLSKIEAGKLELHVEPLHVDEFCQSCLAFVRTQAMEKKIGVTFEPDGSVAHFPADGKRLKQILVNLLSNAVKFTPPGGRIGLNVAAPEGGDAVQFIVWDTGVGIAPADQGKLFRSFTQIDSGLTRAQEGTGLGLALVAKLVELHGGSVALESEPGKGSRFIVTLPRDAASTQPAEPAAKSEPDRRGYRRALIIEDDPTSSAFLVNYLTELGLESVVHVQGEKSVEAVLRERPDVILLDILLPNDSGWVVLTRLKEHPVARHVPVVVISVVDEPEKSRALGAAAHFTKPVTREQLAAFFQRAVVPRLLPAPPCVILPPPTGPTILLAEDNEANIETIGGYLGDKGYTLHYATNGLVAVKLARELRPDVILMDIQMPVMDGLSAIRELRADATFQNTPIVALTALAMPGDRERCLEAGATDYVSKPLSLKALAGLLERLLSTGTVPGKT